MMAHHDNLKIIPLTAYDSESEEEGEIENDASEIYNSNHDQDSECSENKSESLDIMPPQVSTSFKYKNSRKEERKRGRHEQPYSNGREHHRSQERSSSRDYRMMKEHNKNENGSRHTGTNGYRDSSARDQERITRKDGNRIVIDVRDVRLKKELPEVREHQDSKVRDEKHNKNPKEDFEIKEKMKAWKQKREIFMEKKRDLIQNLDEASWQRSDRDLREKLREKDRIQRERRLERFRSPPKEKSDAASVIEKKEFNITPEPIGDEESMSEGSEDDNIDEESGGQGKDTSGAQSDSGSDTASDNEASSESSDDSVEEEEEESSSSVSESDQEEEIVKEKNSKVASEVSEKTSVKAKVNQVKKSCLPIYLPAIQGCRSVEEFSELKRIEEGTYGVVYRAKDKRTNEIVALKRLKMEREKEGFPITSLREINTLLKAQHPNIVLVREIVVGSNMDRIYLSMEYVEHDLKSFMEKMKQPFQVGEVKTLMIQLLSAVAHLHDNWILHRDLKTSNLLLSSKGILKVGDFGLAREYGSPLKSYTSVVVTLWYRAPELLLGVKKYSTSIDVWSVGCIFAELLTMKALFPEKCEADQIKRIFKDLGTPTDKIWPGYSELPLVKKVVLPKYSPSNHFRNRFGRNFTDLGYDLLKRLLTYDPITRISAEDALSHGYFDENPKPVSPSMLPTSTDQSEQPHSKLQSPKPPSGGKQYANQMGEVDDDAGFHMAGATADQSLKGGGFTLKF